MARGVGRQASRPRSPRPRLVGWLPVARAWWPAVAGHQCRDHRECQPYLPGPSVPGPHQAEVAGHARPARAGGPAARAALTTAR